MRASRTTRLLALLISTTALAACGSAAEDRSDEQPTAATSAVPAARPAAHRVPGFPAFSPAPTMLTVVEERPETTVVRHEFGEVEIPKDPQRVYADWGALSIAAFLDLDLAAVDFYEGSDQLPFFADQVGDADAEAFVGDIDVERVAAARPDLILVPSAVREHTSKNPEKIFEQLNRIAPTVVFDADPFAYWEQAALDLSAALGTRAKTEQDLADFDAEVATACKGLRTALGPGTVQTLPVFGTDYYLQGPGQPTDSGGFAPAADTRWLFDYCELDPPASLAKFTAKENFFALSPELLPDVDADHVFVVVADKTSEEGRRALEGNKLWQSTKAARADHDYVMERLSATGTDETLHAINEATAAVERNG